MKLDDALRSPANFQYLVTPVPIARTKRLTRLQKDVWSVVYTRERMNLGDDLAPRVHLSQRQIARLAGTDRKGVKEALEALAEAGVLRIRGQTRGDARQRGRTFLETLWPDWLGVAEDLLGSVRVRVELVDDDENGGEGVSAPLGRGSLPPSGGGEGPPLDQEDKGRDHRSRGAPPRDPPEGTREGGGSGGEEVQESDPDGESRGVTSELEGERDARRERNLRRPRRKELANGDVEHLREPSLRPEMNRWREKGDPRQKWTARDLVGYFVCRYREVFGEESREFFATSDAIFAHHGSNVAKFTKRWLEGDYRRARKIADRILERAGARGMPVKLGYFFTPAKESAVLRLDEALPAKGRAPTPAERNDERGDYDGNREHWDRKRAEFEAREAARKASENGRDDGEVHPDDGRAE
jgi:hypothetical protein